MKTIQERINHLNQLVLEGKSLDAFEMYYDDEVVMQENELQPTVGKEQNRKRENEFFNNVTEFRGARVLNVGSGDNVSFVTWQFDYTHKEWGVRNYTQVSVQHWKDGKIIKEQFFYGN
ncbi:MAG TPA: SnoaL-like domain-containing protein [Chitinophagaceae bacterium]|nr:SnoaL-like domain-containing protein [Chitinophagaceae bacterium]